MGQMVETVFRDEAFADQGAHLRLDVCDRLRMTLRTLQLLWQSVKLGQDEADHARDLADQEIQAALALLHALGEFGGVGRQRRLHAGPLQAGGQNLLAQFFLRTE